MPSKRSYADACGIARALDTLGERWTLMVVRELLLGPKRFTDLRDGLRTIGPDVLTQRLKDLEAAGVVARRTLPPPAASKVYELTPAGHALEPVLQELGRWGGTYAPVPAEGTCMSRDSHLLSMRTLFEPELAGDLRVTVAFRFDEYDFHATVADAEIEVSCGAAERHDLRLYGTADEVISVMHGRLPLAALEIDGDRALAERFFGLFPLPLPA